MIDIEKTELLLLIMSRAKNYGIIEFTRRDISTLYYIVCNLLWDECDIKSSNMLPDGIESEEINRIIDYLIMVGAIQFSSIGSIELTTAGEDVANEIFLSINDKEIGKIIDEVVKLGRKIKIELALTLYSKGEKINTSEEVLEVIKRILSLQRRKSTNQVIPSLKGEKNWK